MVKTEKTSKLIETITKKMTDKDFQNSLDGMSEKDKSKKEFNRLFNAYNLRCVQLEEVWISLLGIPIIETSEEVFNINLYREIGKDKINDCRNMQHLVETAHHDADTDKIKFIDKPTEPATFNKILKSYMSRLDETIVKKRKYKTSFADYDYKDCTFFEYAT